MSAMAVAAATGPPLFLVTTVAVLAVVQSLFGVGLLLFGTPILLLAGMPFEQVLVYLLPCSIVVSTLQVATTGGLTLEPIRRQFLAITAPTVVIATAVSLRVGAPQQLRLWVGVVLLATALTRLGRFQPVLRTAVRRRQRPLMFVLGGVHGLSNLGGGILTVIVSSSHEDKESIRRHIAFAYGVMAVLQLTVVLTTTHATIQPVLWLLLPVIAGSVYLLIGQRTFRATQQAVYQVGLTGLIACFGAILVGAA